MATQDKRRDGTTGYVSGGRPTPRVVERRLKVLSTATSASGDCTSVGAGDVVQLLNIPAGTFVSDVRLEVLTAGTGNISLGDSSSGTVFISAQSIGSTGYIATMAATSKFYSAASDLRVTFASANDGSTASQTPVIKVTAVFVDHNQHPIAGVATL